MIQGSFEVTGRRKRRCKQEVDDFKETRGYWEFYVHVTVHRNKFLYNKTN